MMFGEIDRDGTVTIRFNSLAETLEAPPWSSGEFPFTAPRQWLPCAMCGVVQAVAVNVVSFTCDGCERDLADEDREAELTWLGRVELGHHGIRGEGMRRLTREEHEDQLVGAHPRFRRPPEDLVRGWLRAGRRQARIQETAS